MVNYVNLMINFDVAKEYAKKHIKPPRRGVAWAGLVRVISEEEVGDGDGGDGASDVGEKGVAGGVARF